jgi:hypothetical protein
VSGPSTKLRPPEVHPFPTAYLGVTARTKLSPYRVNEYAGEEENFSSRVIIPNLSRSWKISSA